MMLTEDQDKLVQKEGNTEAEFSIKIYEDKAALLPLYNKLYNKTAWLE